jgi:hypothetical protein
MLIDRNEGEKLIFSLEVFVLAARDPEVLLINHVTLDSHESL